VGPARVRQRRSSQIADRFHLACNSSRVLEHVLYRHAAALRQCVQADLDAAAVIGSGTMAPATRSRARAGRLARYEQVVEVHQQGWARKAIAAQVGLSEFTVRRYLRAESFPEWGPRSTVLRPGTRLGEYLRTRWQAGVQDCHPVVAGIARARVSRDGTRGPAHGGAVA
jgi:Helix-turn-helix domain of resolvase